MVIGNIAWRPHDFFLEGDGTAQMVKAAWYMHEETPAKHFPWQKLRTRKNINIQFNQSLPRKCVDFVGLFMEFLGLVRFINTLNYNTLSQGMHDVQIRYRIKRAIGVPVLSGF